MYDVFRLVEAHARCAYGADGRGAERTATIQFYDELGQVMREIEHRAGLTTKQINEVAGLVEDLLQTALPLTTPPAVA